MAVLVAESQVALPEPARLILRTSAMVTEPLLRHWRQAQLGLLAHALAAWRGAGKSCAARAIGPGRPVPWPQPCCWRCCWRCRSMTG